MPEITVHLETAEGTKLTVSRVTGHEEISRLYEFDVDVVLVGHEGLQADALVNESIDIVFSNEGTHEEVRRIRGMVASVEDMIETEARVAAFRLKIVPPLWRLSLAESSQVYCDMTPPDLIRTLLNERQMVENTDYEFRLQQQYAKREYQVQYKESDLAYLCRVCEHLGISFFFEQKDDHEVLVFVDRTSAFDDHQTPVAVNYRGRGEHDDVYQFTSRTKVIPNKFVVRDYNYRMPSVDLTADATLNVGEDEEVVEYGVHHKTPEEGKYLAKVRAEERLSQRKVYEGKSDLAVVRPGRFLKLEGHPRGEVTFLVVRVEHEAKQSVGTFQGAQDVNTYVNTFSGVGKDAPFRPARITPKPRVPGVITGIIDAESTSDYAQIDSQGRYKVKFVFDWSDNPAGKASHPVRMAQPHAGAGYGMHFPLRPGVEVVLTCVEGDPERPIIAGTVPNPLTQSPVQSGNNTRNIIRTGGGNEINIDDSDTKRIKMTTPHMKTTFQLGAPNEPESGAVLNTQGAWTQFSGAGIGSMTSVKTEFSLLSKMTSAGNVTSIAEKPGKGELALLALEMISTLTELASQGLELYESKKEADLSEKKRLAIRAANSSDEAKNALGELSEAQDEKNKAVQDAKPANLTTAQQAQYDQVQADYADYKAKCANLEAVSTTQNAYVASDRDAMYALERDNDGSSTVKGDEDSVKTQYEALVAAGNTDWKKLDHAVYQAALYVLRDRAPIDAARADMEAAAKKLSDDCDAAKNDAPDDEAYKSALDGLKDNADEYPDASKELEDKERESSEAKNEALQDEYDENYSETGSNVKKAVADLKTITTAETGVSFLASVIIAAINYFKSTDELLEANKAWKEFGSQLAKAKPKHADGAKWAFTMTNPLMPCYNLVKAEDSTIITGDWKTFIHAPTVGIHAHELEAAVLTKATTNAATAAKLAANTALKTSAEALVAAAKTASDAYTDAKQKVADGRKAIGQAKAMEKPGKIAALIPLIAAERAAKKASEAADKAAAKATSAASDGVLSIGADKLLVVSSVENMEIVSKDALWLTAEKSDYKVEKDLTLEAEKGAVTISAPDKTVSISSKDSTTLAGKVVSLTATAGSAVTADDTGVTIATAPAKPVTIDAGVTGKIELKAGNFTLTIDSSGIKLANAAGTSQILVGPVKIDAKAQNSTVSINPINVQLATSANKLTIPMSGPAQINAMNVALG